MFVIFRLFALVLYVYISVHVYIYVSIYIDASWPVIIPFTRIMQLYFAVSEAMSRLVVSDQCVTVIIPFARITNSCFTRRRGACCHCILWPCYVVPVQSAYYAVVIVLLQFPR